MAFIGYIIPLVGYLTSEVGHCQESIISVVLIHNKEGPEVPRPRPSDPRQGHLAPVLNIQA